MGSSRKQTNKQTNKHQMALSNTNNGNNWLFDPFNSLATRSWIGDAAPSFELTETDSAWELSSSVPVPHEKVDININDDSIEISGANHKTKTSQENGWTCTSSSSASFFRRVPIPEGVDASRIETTNDNGILKISMPKASS